MDGNGVGNTNWDFKKGDDICDSTSIGSVSEDSMNTVSSCYSSELTEEANSSTSTSTSSSSSHSNGPLHELSQLMNHLPIKRGLSMFYEGKSESFTSLARVQSIQDLPKKDTPCRKKMKSCKSYGGGLDSHKTSHSPKVPISKKSSRGSSSVSAPSQRESFLGGSNSFSIEVQKNF